MTTLPMAWWMRTKLGQWLATNVGLFAFLWRRNVERELHAVATSELAFAKQKLIQCADDYVFDMCIRGELVGAVCAYRNALDRWKRTKPER